jgi:hypothetical protein
MSDRPAEGPDREALRRHLEWMRDQAGSYDTETAAREALALLPTPPAPDDDLPPGEWCATHNVYDCAERGPCAPGGGEGLRAEVERLCDEAERASGNEVAWVPTGRLRAALAARDTDTADRALAAELAKAHERIASLEWLLSHSRVARDTDQGVCTCEPCPGRGNDGHGLTHCAECCMGTGVVDFDPACPLPQHRDLARQQHRDTDQGARDALAQVDHLDTVVRQLREQGDVRQVSLADDGVTEAPSLADELWLIAYNLRAVLARATPEADPTDYDG